jgi:hypothetical protein
MSGIDRGAWILTKFPTTRFVYRNLHHTQNMITFSTTKWFYFCHKSSKHPPINYIVCHYSLSLAGLSSRGQQSHLLSTSDWSAISLSTINSISHPVRGTIVPRSRICHDLKLVSSNGNCCGLNLHHKRPLTTIDIGQYDVSAFFLRKLNQLIVFNTSHWNMNYTRPITILIYDLTW